MACCFFQGAAPSARSEIVVLAEALDSFERDPWRSPFSPTPSRTLWTGCPCSSGKVDRPGSRRRQPAVRGQRTPGSHRITPMPPSPPATRRRPGSYSRTFRRWPEGCPRRCCSSRRATRRPSWPRKRRRTTGTRRPPRARRRLVPVPRAPATASRQTTAAPTATVGRQGAVAGGPQRLRRARAQTVGRRGSRGAASDGGDRPQANRGDRRAALRPGTSDRDARRGRPHEPADRRADKFGTGGASCARFAIPRRHCPVRQIEALRNALDRTGDAGAEESAQRESPCSHAARRLWRPARPGAGHHPRDHRPSRSPCRASAVIRCGVRVPEFRVAEPVLVVPGDGVDR